MRYHQLRRALNGASLITSEGAPPLAGDALERLATEYLTTEAVIDRLSMGMDAGVLRALLNMPSIALDTKEGATEASKAIYGALAPHAPKAHIERDPTSDGWRVRLEKLVHGNRVETILDHAFVGSGGRHLGRGLAFCLRAVVPASRTVHETPRRGPSKSVRSERTTPAGTA